MDRSPISPSSSKTADATSTQALTLEVGQKKSQQTFDELGPSLDAYSLEDIIEVKISRFLDQIGSFYPENIHDLVMSKVEKPLLSQILRRVGGNQVHASKILGINRNTLRKKIRIYGL